MKNRLHLQFTVAHHPGAPGWSSTTLCAVRVSSPPSMRCASPQEHQYRYGRDEEGAQCSGRGEYVIEWELVSWKVASSSLEATLHPNCTQKLLIHTETNTILTAVQDCTVIPYTDN
jgi:hypothetical protein